ncbi:MAG: CpsD/CapB family tyrosine-protein kinase, partial [Chloroflexi bacterium]
MLIGLVNGLSLAILLELLDTRIRTEEALTQFVDWSVLATVWRADSFKKDKHKHEALVDPPPHSANVESYRILRTNIGFSVLDKPLRSIMVTSASPHEGKSTIAANLAIFMAKAGKKTLLIDADLRRPSVGKIFHLPTGTIGLSNAILTYANLQFA